jgi:hypothetical protein
LLAADIDKHLSLVLINGQELFSNINGLR